MSPASPPPAPAAWTDACTEDAIAALDRLVSGLGRENESPFGPCTTPGPKGCVRKLTVHHKDLTKYCESCLAYVYACRLLAMLRRVDRSPQIKPTCKEDEK